MASQNSQIGFITDLLHQLILDIVQHHAEPTLLLDYETICKRVNTEGFAFVSKTLPLLAKAIDSALVCGRLTCPTNFKKYRKTSLPLIFSGLTKRIFECDGTVKTDPDVTAVRDLRQICYLFYKYEQPKDKSKEVKHIAEFFSIDASLFDSFDEFTLESGHSPDSTVTRIITAANTLLRGLLRNYDSYYIEPSHGNGAVATGEKNWEKCQFKRFYPFLHKRFPYYKFFFSNAMALAENVDMYKRIKSNICYNSVAQMLEVPKDSRGGRLISEEPLEIMWIQKGLQNYLYEYVEQHPLTRGYVNFTDQSVNRNLALEGSMSGDYVTLDMKEASDRIALWLVKLLFDGTPLLQDLLSCRSSHTHYDGIVHRLRKFAPMGSALCFPIMALSHWALSVSALREIDGMSLAEATNSVWVYGDDIIIKGKNYKTLFDIFPKLGLKFNEGKCCTTGFFRESCGMDAFHGQSVTPIKLKKNFPSRRTDAVGIQAFVDKISQFGDDAYYRTAAFLRGALEKILEHPIPVVLEAGQAVAILSNRPTMTDRIVGPKRFNKNLFVMQHLSDVLVPESLEIETDRCELIRCISKRGELRSRLRCLMPQSRSQAKAKRSLDWLFPKSGTEAGVYGVPHSISLKRGYTTLRGSVNTATN